MKNKNFFKIINYIYKENKDNVKIASSYKDLFKLNKKEKFILFKSKKNFYQLSQIYFFLIKNKIKFKKNIIIFTQINNIIHGQNIIPEWTGYFPQRGTFFKFFSWLRIFLFNIYHLNNSIFILIEKK